MESEQRHGLAASLALQAGKDANAAQIADALVAIWQKIEVALTPVVGQRGIAALYKRSLHLAAPAYPWLSAAGEDVQTVVDFAALKSIVEKQSATDAGAAADALLQTFHKLLSSLIGPSLTERLLRSAWAHSLSPPA